MPYIVYLFAKPGPHREGAYNHDIKRIGPLLPDINSALILVSRIMAKYREKGLFVRVDKNRRMNPVVYADLNESGGIVRFKERDGIHWTSAIPLPEFRHRLARRIAH